MAATRVACCVSGGEGDDSSETSGSILCRYVKLLFMLFTCILSLSEALCLFVDGELQSAQDAQDLHFFHVFAHRSCLMHPFISYKTRGESK